MNLMPLLLAILVAIGYCKDEKTYEILTRLNKKVCCMLCDDSLKLSQYELDIIKKYVF